jgi:hypothetical protein
MNGRGFRGDPLVTISAKISVFFRTSGRRVLRPWLPYPLPCECTSYETPVPGRNENVPLVIRLEIEAHRIHLNVRRIGFIARRNHRTVA